MKYLSKVFIISIYQNLCEFAQRTLFLNFNMKHMTTVIIVRFLFSLLSSSSDVPSLYFFRLSKVWSMSHHGSEWRVQNQIKNTLIYFQVLFLAVVAVFHSEICVFIIMYALDTAYLLLAGIVS